MVDTENEAPERTGVDIRLPNPYSLLGKAIDSPEFMDWLWSVYQAVYQLEENYKEAKTHIQVLEAKLNR